MRSSELSAWYVSRGIVLWVEDDLTRTYLRALWQDPEIRFLVAGGSEAVVAAVRDARVNAHANVFGVRDRDFMDSNHADWLVPHKQTEVFRPQRHEIERVCVEQDRHASPPQSSEVSMDWMSSTSTETVPAMQPDGEDTAGDSTATVLPRKVSETAPSCAARRTLSKSRRATPTVNVRAAMPTSSPSIACFRQDSRLQSGWT